MKEILPWVMILLWEGQGGSAHHVEFETRQLCESAKGVIHESYGRVHGWKPRAFCVQRALVNSNRIKPE
jgi:hypothetical protein